MKRKIFPRHLDRVPAFSDETLARATQHLRRLTPSEDVLVRTFNARVANGLPVMQSARDAVVTLLTAQRLYVPREDPRTKKRRRDERAAFSLCANAQFALVNKPPLRRPINPQDA